MSPYETFEHTADIGLRVCAPDLPSLFAEAGRGLLAILAGDVGSVRCTVERRLRLRADGTENLLVDWLSEILFLFETEGLLLARFEVTISPQGGGRGGRGGLDALARGEPLDPRRHRLEREIKGITYHGLRVERGPEGWVAQCILDI